MTNGNILDNAPKFTYFSLWKNIRYEVKNSTFLLFSAGSFAQALCPTVFKQTDSPLARTAHFQACHLPEQVRVSRQSKGLMTQLTSSLLWQLQIQFRRLRIQGAAAVALKGRCCEIGPWALRNVNKATWCPHPPACHLAEQVRVSRQRPDNTTHFPLGGVH